MAGNCHPVTHTIDWGMGNDVPTPEHSTPVAMPSEPVPHPSIILHALGNPLRWEVLRILALEGPQSVGELGGRMDRAQPAMSRHLTALWKAGAVLAIAPPDGDTRKQFYAIPPEQLRTVPGGKEIDYGVCVLRFR